MKPKIIHVSFRDRRESREDARPPQPRTGWSREEWRVWQKLGCSSQDNRFLPFLFAALAVHVGIALFLIQFEPEVAIEARGQTGPARITFFEGEPSTSLEEGLPELQVYPNKEIDTAILTGPSTSSGRPEARPKSPKQVESKDPVRVPENPQGATLRSRERASNTDRPSIPPMTPQQPDAPMKEELSKGESQEPQGESLGFSRELADLLPNSMSEFVASQRRIGSVYGQGAVGGDLSPDAREPVGFRQQKKDRFTVTRYDYASYFMSLDRRFSEAWGNVRFLPPNSNFVGKVGEFIEYDIIINRDGTLVKIVNITKKSQPHRNFDPVDRLVGDVFARVFPMKPIPERIKDDPLILRKRIQFTGYQFFFF